MSEEPRGKTSKTSTIAANDDELDYDLFRSKHYRPQKTGSEDKQTQPKKQTSSSGKDNENSPSKSSSQQSSRSESLPQIKKLINRY